MQIDPNNPVVKLCADGMQLEGQGKPNEAKLLFGRAWTIATTDFEKFTAAHYVARHQDSVVDKLHWDKIALTHALALEKTGTIDVLASLYLNIAKCYEDLSDYQLANENYQTGLSYAKTDSGYDNMIRSGLEAGLTRIHAYAVKK